jgi:hypothetical protein
MIARLDTHPDVDVRLAEYIRLLGYPRGWVLEGRALELAEWARAWYAEHGRPWVAVRRADRVEIGPEGAVTLDGVTFTSVRLWKTFREAVADGAWLAAVSAGPELEAEAQRLWQEGKPDEYFFLEVYGSALVEHLVTMTGARLCAWADGARLAVLPHYSPGYPEWPIAEQPRLLQLLAEDGDPSPLPLEVLESGMLRPKKSLLAVFGLTRAVERVTRLNDLVPCENCSFAPCQYRRAPYRRSPEPADPELGGASATGLDAGGAPPLDRQAAYTTNRRALQRWTNERLVLDPQADGTVRAVFRYDGTTCTNMGRPLQFLYHVTLGPRADGYPILEQRCGPAEGDEGHRHMCGYLTNREGLMRAIGDEQPLHGRPLNDVVVWSRVARPAGCYCDADSRHHKWGLVLETIHFALAQRD